MPNDQPVFSQDYRPSCKLRLVLRLEEYGEPISDADPTKLTKPQLRKGVHDSSSMLSYSVDPDSPGGVRRFLIGSSSGTSMKGGPQQVDSDQHGTTFVVGAVIPSDCTVGRNGWKQGDTCDVAFRYEDLPIDPAVVRSCAIEVYMGTVSADDYAKGISGEIRTITSGAQTVAEPLHVVPDNWQDAFGLARTNLRFQGWVDSWEFEWRENDISVVRLKCVDNTKLLQDTEVGPLTAVDFSKPFDEAIAQFLAMYPQFAGLTVEYRPAIDSSKIPVLSKVLDASAYRPDQAGAGPSKGGGASHNKLSVWDYLIEVALLVGHNLRVEGSNIVIQRVRTATGKAFPPRFEDPFKGRDWGGKFHQLRAAVWGKNIKSWKKGRKYSRCRRNVEVTCYNPERKKRLWAFHPPSPTSRTTHVLPGNGRNDTKYEVHTVFGVKDQTTLQMIAQHYYEGLNRSEVHIRIDTIDLASYGGDNSDPDWLDMLAGDKFEAVVLQYDSLDPNAPAATLSVIEDAATLKTQALDALTDAALDSGLVNKYAEVYGSQHYQFVYVCRAMEMRWNKDKGIEVGIDGVNMIEVALDAGSGFDDADLLASSGQQSNTKTQPGGP